MRHDGVDWKRQYLKVGQYAAVYPTFPDRRPPFVGIVQRIKKNRYGRISYVIGDYTAQAEELFPGKGEQKLKIPKMRET